MHRVTIQRCFENCPENRHVWYSEQTQESMAGCEEPASSLDSRISADNCSNYCVTFFQNYSVNKNNSPNNSIVIKLGSFTVEPQFGAQPHFLEIASLSSLTATTAIDFAMPSSRDRLMCLRKMTRKRQAL